MQWSAAEWPCMDVLGFNADRACVNFLLCRLHLQAQVSGGTWALQMIADPDSVGWLSCGRSKSPDALALVWAV